MGPSNGVFDTPVSVNHMSAVHIAHDSVQLNKHPACKGYSFLLQNREENFFGNHKSTGPCNADTYLSSDAKTDLKPVNNKHARF
jgi:hypothetical protein